MARSTTRNRGQGTGYREQIACTRYRNRHRNRDRDRNRNRYRSSELSPLRGSAQKKALLRRRKSERHCFCAKPQKRRRRRRRRKEKKERRGLAAAVRCLVAAGAAWGRYRHRGRNRNRISVPDRENVLPYKSRQSTRPVVTGSGFGSGSRVRARDFRSGSPIGAPDRIRDTFVGPDRRKAARGWPVFGAPAIRLPVLDEKIRPDT